jgi:hypothetical protein
MIGGEHFIHVPEVTDSLNDLFVPIKNQTSFYATGRDAFFSILAYLRPTRVWLPNFLCESIFEAAGQNGELIACYPMSVSLESDLKWTRDVRPGDTVLVIHYFGDIQKKIIETVSRLGATSVSDSTHLLLNQEAWDEALVASDWVFGSLRKSGPFPDGGFCIRNKGIPPSPTLPPRKQFWALRAAALLSRGASAYHDFDNDENWELITEADKELIKHRPGSYAMSYLSKSLLRSIPMATKRDAMSINHKLLVEGLPSSLIHPIALRSTSPYVPCLFPSRMARDEVRSMFAKLQMFFPIHWETDFLATPHDLSGRILSIPCDDRYGEADMLRIVEAMRGRR